MQIFEELNSLLSQGYIINIFPRTHSTAGINIFKHGEVQHKEQIIATESVEKALYRCILAIDELNANKE